MLTQFLGVNCQNVHGCDYTMARQALVISRRVSIGCDEAMLVAARREKGSIMNTNKSHSHALFKVLGLLFGVTLLWAAGGTLAHAQATLSGQDWVAAPDPAAAPEAQTPPTAPAPGVYVFLDWRNMNPQQYPFVVGGHQVFKWDRVRGRRSGRIRLGRDRLVDRG